jgi:pimeloyl-ACP methyl ester carboxylesterase
VLVDQPRGPAKGVFLLFPGGEGFLLNADGTLGGRFGGFRKPLAEAGYAVATVDVPSDHPGGLGSKGEKVEAFRVSAEHTADARKIVDALHARWPQPVVLMGHSMGAISAAHLAASLEDARIAALVLLSSPGERGPRGYWVSVPTAALSRVKVPVLLVHHRDDGCPGARYLTAKFYPGKFTASPRTGFIEAAGGSSESSDPCSGNNFHSFFGIRPQVMHAVLAWLAGAGIERVGG